MFISLWGKKIFFGGIYFLLFGLPLIFDKGIFLSFEEPKTNFAYAMVLVISLGWLVTVFTERRRKRKNEESMGISVLAIIFAFILVLTSVFGKDWSQSFWGSYWRRQGILTGSFYFLFFFLTSEAFVLGLCKKLAALSIVLGAFFAGLFVLNQAYHYFYLQDGTILTYNGRLTGTFSNPNIMAGFFALSLPFALYLLKISGRWREKLFFFLTALLMTAAAFFAFSKSGMLSLLAVFFLYLVFKGGRFCWRNILFFAFLLFLVSSFLKLGFSRPSFYESRRAIWENAWEAILQRPLSGYGWENFEYAMKEVVTRDDPSIYNYYIDRAHNEFLEITTASGFFGLIVYFLILFFSFKRAFWRYKKTKGEEKEWYQALILSLSAFLIFSQFGFFLTTGYILFWFVLGAINE